MRIIAGKFKGKKLAKSDHLKDLRPTTDRCREALFNILSSHRIKESYNFDLKNSNVLDLCCGTGAVAFESLSRSAKSAVLVDKNFQHLELARKNAEILGLGQQVTFLNCDANKLPPNKQIFDLIFVDPPYEQDCQKILTSIKNWISDQSLIIVESGSSGKSLCENNYLEILEERIYGQSRFTFLKKKSSQN